MDNRDTPFAQPSLPAQSPEQQNKRRNATMQTQLNSSQSVALDYDEDTDTSLSKLPPEKTSEESLLASFEDFLGDWLDTCSDHASEIDRDERTNNTDRPRLDRAREGIPDEVIEAFVCYIMKAMAAVIELGKYMKRGITDREIDSRPWFQCGKLRQYEYAKLDMSRQQIRLFRIVLDSVNNAHGELRTFDLSAPPPYRALSYTWGSSEDMRQIPIDLYSYHVRQNLFDFLQIYKVRNIGEWIWIDQLSIDQNMLSERNHQVRLMSSIYRGAVEVIIWLSAEKPFQDSYWERVWIVQEVLLAKALRIYHRRQWPDWEDLKKTIPGGDAVSDLLYWLRDGILNPSFLNHEADIAEIFAKTRASCCQDPRDKIYGVQSLLPERKRVEIDYTKSVKEVYVEAVIHVLSTASWGWIRSGALWYLGRGMGLRDRDQPDSLSYESFQALIRPFEFNMTSDARRAYLRARLNSRLVEGEPVELYAAKKREKVFSSSRSSAITLADRWPEGAAEDESFPETNDILRSMSNIIKKALMMAFAKKYSMISDTNTAPHPHL